MTNLIANDKQMELIIQHMEQSSKGVRIMYESMQNMQTEIKGELKEVKEVQESLKKNITLNRGEQGRLRSAVTRKSEYLTRQFFRNKVSEELFSAKRGHTLAYIWIVLKTYYNVGTYPEISHVEFDNTMKMVRGLTIEDFPEAYYRLTPKMQEVAIKNNDQAHHIYFGEDSNQNYLF